MTIEINPLTIHTGAEISSIDLNQPISDSDAKDIWDAFLKWKVVFFRDQPMSHTDQVAFGRRFGELTIGHAVFGHVDGYPEVYSIAKDRWDNRYKPAPKNIRPWTGFHADITAAVNPPAVSILRGVTIPPYGGDTLWANLVVAYDSLSEPIRNFVDGLRGLHKFQPPTEVDITEEYRAMQKRRRNITSVSRTWGSVSKKRTSLMNTKRRAWMNCSNGLNGLTRPLLSIRPRTTKPMTS